MTASNFNFFMHSIMLIYKDVVEACIIWKGQQLQVDDGYRQNIYFIQDTVHVGKLCV